jgi:hypothetical protein
MCRLHTETCQRVGHAARALREIAVLVPVDVSFYSPRHNFLCAVMAFSMHEQRSDQQRLLHHQALHSLFS